MGKSDPKSLRGRPSPSPMAHSCHGVASTQAPPTETRRAAVRRRQGRSPRLNFLQTHAREPGSARPCARQSVPRIVVPMVRRDAAEASVRRGPGTAAACCTTPAGESPVPVGVGAPGSRPQAGGEIPVSRAGRQEPLRREQPRGPQHEVKPAASSESQSGSRAAHFTAKATLSAPSPEGVESSGGVRGAAREEGEERNTRGPSAQLSSQQSVSYKSKTKSSGVQRESEGVVVLVTPE